MDLRAEMVTLYEDGISATELSEYFGVSRKTIYKWIGRHESRLNLDDQSRAPKTSPHRTAEELVRAIVEERGRHPSWGPRKIRKVLLRRSPEVAWPARSTVGDVLKRAGCIGTTRMTRRMGRGPSVLTEPTTPNRVWPIDFKGQFRLGNGRYCYPLTITDGYSRFLLACSGLESTRGREVRQVFDRVFREYGVPEVIRSDNGIPFVHPSAMVGLSSLAVWWIKLGIRPERTRPGRPADNGAHERMHKTLKREATRPAEPTFRKQQGRFDRFRQEYNQERPHEALGDRTPAELYARSTRSYSGKVPAISYPAHLDTRKVSSTGLIKLSNHAIYLSQTVAGEFVSVEEIDDGVWEFRFASVFLARFSEREKRLFAPSATP